MVITCFGTLGGPNMDALPKSHSTILQRLRRQISLDYYTLATQAIEVAWGEVTETWLPAFRGAVLMSFTFLLSFATSRTISPNVVRMLNSSMFL